MRDFIAKALHSAANWLTRKAFSDADLLKRSYTEPGAFIDSFNKHREPTAREMMNELKNAAYTCITINSGVCAAHPPKIYVTTNPGDAAPKCGIKPVTDAVCKAFSARSDLHPIVRKADAIHEVTEHPIVNIFSHPNPHMNGWDLWELTTLYQEVTGNCFWLVKKGRFRVPRQVWVLPAHRVRLHRKWGSPEKIDWFEFTNQDGQIEKFLPEDIIHFKYPDPRDPWGPGMGPLRGCFENVALGSLYLAFKRSLWDNGGLPKAILSPDEVIGEQEVDRLEKKFQEKFGKGGHGRLMVAESKMQLQLLSYSMADLAALQEYGATKEDIFNAFHLPQSYVSKETNLANLEASERQHMSLAIRPRVTRRDEKINEKFIPLYDPTGRLFVASEDPVPETRDSVLRQQQIDLQNGVKSINEVRGERGLPQVPWGNVPWLPLSLAPTNQHFSQQAIEVNRDGATNLHSDAQPPAAQ